ncbi:helix-turn-helix domain-containing protein [Streptomyces sp. NPDC002619]|uniref:helix-turn-helix domain-containing protein n=1 Tax=Streptomyces sp. NPDC002619 TaxID=3364655 RepID=UPI0036A4E964
MGEEQPESTFAAELRRLRQRAQMTLDGLADASGVSARTIGGLERGHSLGPQRRTVTALADGLGLDEAEQDALERLANVGRPRPVTAPAGWCVPPRPVRRLRGPPRCVGRADAAYGFRRTHRGECHCWGPLCGRGSA